MKIALLSFLTVLSFNSEAKLNRLMGNWGSGGGNALVCFGQVTQARDGEVIIRDIVSEVRQNQNTISDEHLQYISSIELFDLYEAKKRRGLNSTAPEIIEIQETEAFYDYFDRLGKRFEKAVWSMYSMIDAGKNLIPDTHLVFYDFAVEILWLQSDLQIQDRYER